MQTALAHAFFVLTNSVLDCPGWRAEIRKVKRAMTLHIPKQALPATLLDIKRAIAREPLPRVRLGLRLLWGLGLRAGHVSRFRGVDIVNHDTLEKDRVAILRARGLKGMCRGKRGYFKVLPFNGVCAPLLPHLLQKFAPKQILFPVRYGELVKALKRSNRSLTGHSARVGLATHMANRGASTRQIRDVLGHETSQSTRMYVLPRAMQRDIQRKSRLIASMM
jgi:integrase